MCQQRFSQLMFAVVCVAATAVATNEATATFIELNPDGSGTSVVLADLLDGTYTGVTVGDKSFDEFFYATLPNDDMPEPEDINVFGFQDLDGNFGLTFQGAFIDLPGGIGLSDATLSFTVSVTEEAARQGYRISDAHLFAEGVGLGPESFFAVDESFAQSGSDEKLNVFATTLNGSDESVLSDWVFFDELYTSLRVTKDILAIANDDSNQPVRATIIRQSFSQVKIPEPASLGLAALCAVGIAMGRRKF
ncbi:MAG: PEP-CTERM sorting domain-containing protein [Planctomycetota bacterium]